MSDITISDLAKALWIDAGKETDPVRKSQLEEDARRFEDILSRSKYALAPTRDQMMYAVGTATLNLDERLDKVLTLTTDTNTKMNGLALAVGTVVHRIDRLEQKIEAMELQIADLLSRDRIIEILQAHIKVLDQKIVALTRQTLSDVLDRDERLALTETNRWVASVKQQLEKLLKDE